MEQINWKTNISITNDKIKQSLVNYLLSKKFKETESEDGTYYLYHIDSQYFADFSYTISITIQDIENSYSDIIISFSYGETLNKFYYDEIIINGQYLYSNINRIDNILIDKIGKVLNCISVLESQYKNIALLHNLDNNIDNHKPKPLWKIKGSNGKEYTDLQQAIDEVYSSGGEVWIAKGVYKHGSSLTMKNNVAIYGGFIGLETSKEERTSGNTTIIDGEGKYMVFYNNYSSSNPLTNSAKLDNVTIQNGYTSGSGAGMYNNYASPEITNCTFVDNRASIGGGMWNYSYSSPVLTNCTFANNNALRFGSGMCNNSSSPVLTNCTFSNNSAKYYGGGMYNASSSPELTNCILWGNTADYDNEIYNSSSNSNPTIDTCIIEGGYSDNGTYTNIITEDPLLQSLANNGGFVPTIAVEAGSSAIGAGKVIDGVTTDARGIARSKTAPTIGAYEYVD